MRAYLSKPALVFALILGSSLESWCGTLPERPWEVGPAWAKAWNAKQLDQAALLYAQDSIFIHPTGERVVGSAAIAALLRDALAINNPHIVFKSQQRGEANDTAWDSGSFRETITPVQGGPTQHLHGNYLLILRRASEGGWQIERMVWQDKS